MEKQDRARKDGYEAMTKPSRVPEGRVKSHSIYVRILHNKLMLGGIPNSTFLMLKLVYG